MKTFEEFGPEQIKAESSAQRARIANAQPIDIRIWIDKHYPYKSKGEKAELESTIILYLSEIEFLPV